MRKIMGPWLDRYWRLIVSLWLIIFTALVFLGLHDLRANQHRIQDSRVESCQRTYLSFPLVFTPFFPPASKQTTLQKKNFAKLSKVAQRLAARCTSQTTP